MHAAAANLGLPHFGVTPGWEPAAELRSPPQVQKMQRSSEMLDKKLGETRKRRMTSLKLLEGVHRQDRNLQRSSTLPRGHIRCQTVTTVASRMRRMAEKERRIDIKTFENATRLESDEEGSLEGEPLSRNDSDNAKWRPTTTASIQAA